jgi:hypothetical protein
VHPDDLQMTGRIGLFAILGTVGAFCTACVAAPSTSRAYTSPDGTYTVTLRGGFERPSRMFIQHRVVGDVTKGGSAFAQLGTLHYSDSLDEGFDRRFRTTRWSDAQTLQFLRLQLDAPCDRLTIRNTSDHDSKYVLIQAGDLVVLLDLVRGTQKEIGLTSLADSTPFVSVEAQLVGSRSIRAAQNFSDTVESNMRRHFWVGVGRDSISITETREGDTPQRGLVCGQRDLSSR